MPAPEPTADLRAELFTRTDLPAPARRRRDAVVETLSRLAERDRLAAEVTEWERRVPVGAPSPERDRYEAFSDWASDVGVSLDPFFDTRRCYGTDTGRMRTELILPVMCLAVSAGGTLETVAPHADGRLTVSVEDAIDDLAVDTRSREADSEPLLRP